MSTYDGAQWYDVIEEGCETRAWLLTMEPIPGYDELPLILDDLNRGIGVTIGHQGRIYHSIEQCDIPLRLHNRLLPSLRIEPFTYQVELTYRHPYRDIVGPTQPKARILSPEISTRKYPNHPHMYTDVTRLDSWACPLSPQNSAWQYRKGATVEYLDQLAIWLLKTVVWAMTGGIAGIGKWIGPATSHKAIDLLYTVKISDSCWCGSGRTYEYCHFKPDLMRAIHERQTPSIIL